ncbi:F0F1 ATP synthase subunit B [Anaeroselena agilis]|uniref:ATP synthase subunit b n=1 Tax=Anaeroselena agilis TaxID=3063788 RepID=A0ABU3P406_9FIRM|nr:F0F1 ATP synthase subunit B [Selenomonadales bacterium 4137-cl]
MVELNATLIAQIINFLLLAYILKKFVFGKVLQAMSDRQARIAGSIESADRERAAAEELKREYQEQLAQARTQAQTIVEKATKLAEQAKDDIIKEARAEHARLMKEAQEEIARERERAVAELRNEVVSLSIAAAGKIIGQNLDANANAKLVSDFINNLDGQKIGGVQ